MQTMIKQLSFLVLICETWCNPDINNASLNIGGYTFQTELRLDRTDTTNGIGGGIVVYTKEGLKILCCDQVQSFNQYCKFKLATNHDELFFYVIY
jgi:hypothetical protein